MALRTIAKISLFIATFFSASQTYGEPSLFKDFHYGAELASIQDRYNIYECEAEVFCLDQQEFMGKEVTLLLTFLNGKLVQVGVSFDYFSTSVYPDVLIPLITSEAWQLVMLQNLLTNERFDFLYEASIMGLDEASRLLNEFEQVGLSDGGVVYIIIEAKGENDVFFEADSVSSLMDLVDTETRELDFYFDENNEQIYFLITMPNLFIDEASEKEVEDF